MANVRRNPDRSGRSKAYNSMHLRASNVTKSKSSSAKASTTSTRNTEHWEWRSILQEGIVTVRVGLSMTTFQAYRGLLSTSSDFFKKRLSGKWPNQQQEICLDEESPDDFVSYVMWLQKREVSVPESSSNFEDGSQTPKKLMAQFRALVDLYVFGDFIDDGLFQDCVMDKLVLLHKQLDCVRVEMVTYVYDNTRGGHPRTIGGSKLRRLLVDTFVYLANKQPTEAWASMVGKDEREPCKAFLIEAVERCVDLNKAKRLQAPWEMNKCYYHLHRPVSAAGASGCIREKTKGK